MLHGFSIAAVLGCAIDHSWVYSFNGKGGASAADQQSTWPIECTAGERQSPIDIQSTTAEPAPELNGALEVHIRRHVPLLYNTGVYFELDKQAPEHMVRRSGDPTAHAASQSRGKGWSRILNESYRFYQVHWHTPSENRVDGKEFALEAHFVHQLDDARLVGTNERIGVVAILYELGECSVELDQFWARLPMAPGDAPFDEQVDVGSWIERVLPGGYYSWSGSLTTPPCTEGVVWNLLRTPLTVCQRQVDRLKMSLVGMRDGVGVNNRVVQPLHGRGVRVSTGASAVGGASAPSTLAPQSGRLFWTMALLLWVGSFALLVWYCERWAVGSHTPLTAKAREYADLELS